MAPWVLIANLVMAVPSASQAYSGLELLEYCEAQAATESAGRCSGYIVGVSDMVFSEKDSGGICPEGLVTREQAESEVLAYLATDARRLHMPAALLVVEALRKAYPCATP